MKSIDLSNSILGMCLLVIVCDLKHVQSQTCEWVVFAGKAGSPGTADGTNTIIRFSDSAQGMAINSQGELFIADSGNYTVRKLTREGTNWVSTTIAGKAGISASADGTNGTARFGLGMGQIAVDKSGNVYVADYGNSTIRKITPEGTNWVTSTIAGLAGHPGSADGTNSAVRLNSPNGVTVAGNGNLYIADYGNNRIRKIFPDGTNWITTTIAGSGPGNIDGMNRTTQFSHPVYITTDLDGSLFVVDQGNNTIRKMTLVETNWITTTIAGLAGKTGRADGPNNTARFNSPNGVALDNEGNLFLSDTGNDLVRKITRSGTNWVTSTVVTIAQGPNGTVHFPTALGIAVGVSGTVYIVDSVSSTIREGILLPRIENITRAGDDIEITWSAVVGQKLQVQFTSELGSSTWTNIRDAMTAIDDTLSIIDTLTPNAVRFYRIEVVP